MRYPGIRWLTAGVVLLAASALPAVAGEVEPAVEPLAPPLSLAPLPRSPRADKPVYLQQDPDSIYPPTIYAPVTPPKPDEGVNMGGVNLSLTVNYMTDYVYRGVDRSEVGGSEDAPNLQFDGKISFNLGKLPHPVVGLFVNVYNDDPISRFQEIRPFVGLEWTLRPLILTAGYTTYIFPEREDLNTNEVYASIALDDSFFFNTKRPILSPYIYGAYDFDRFDGLYLEAGLKHDFVLEDLGVTITAVADIAYVLNQTAFSANGVDDTGFQHYDVGLVGTYSLNTLLNIPKRYGSWSIKGYVFYTDNIDNKLKADSQLWGGVGINFEY